MTIPLRATVSLFSLAVLIGAASSCGNSPAEPGAVTSPPAPTILRISGPSSLALGGTAQFTAVAEFSDGHKEDVTSTAAWRSSAADVLAFSPGSAGRATGTGPGEAVVDARFGTISSGIGLTALVLEPGTYRLSGVITGEFGAIEGATVEIASGTGTGRRATTNPSGQYAVYGVAGAVDVNVSASGFTPLRAAAIVSGNSAADFSLHSLVPPANLAGAWTMTFKAASACSGQLPESARERSFTVDVTESVSRIRLNFRNGSGYMDGQITTTSLIIPMEGDYGIFEGIAGIGSLAIQGNVTAALHDDDMRGVFSGSFTIYGKGATPATCVDPAHEFILQRLAR